MSILQNKTDKEISNIIEQHQYLTIASIDPGEVNFCIKIEQRYKDTNSFVHITEI